ncbi:MFS transporter [Desulfosoma caldarium]|uniref:DHA1 family multidrug resistance protein-like MFS transporter n=1 Tax=Desulfosoma caldarium TaxID=610254 RepID=A0A3N1USZ1_9BACT|nr:MFS transporter [Desulfosoma caldarium]ROQ93263.1 DHA1 family multidrug resistance protein-like MFS transporter [Desulfosoma caldarium]
MEGASWQRTLWIMFVAQLLSAVGFSVIFPFLPLYVQQLPSLWNVNAKLLAGLVFSAQALTMMVASPIWGGLADRFGRKLMVERSLFGGAVVLAAMAFVRSAEELVGLRALQGLITGTISAANALVAASTPRHRIGYAMGVMQLGLTGGIAVGPLLGGILADSLGYRAAFWVTGALLAAAGVLVAVGVEEVFEPSLGVPRGGVSSGLWKSWRSVLQRRGVGMAYGLRFFAYLGRMMIVPIAPFFIQTLLEPDASVNTFTGLVFAVVAFMSALSAVLWGKLGDRIGHERVLVMCALMSGLAYLPQSLVQEAWQLLALQAVFGLALGGTLPSTSALLAAYTAQGEEGSVYGLDSSVVSGSRAIAPLLGAAVAQGFGLRATFTATGILFLVMGLLALRVLPPSSRSGPSKTFFSRDVD